MIKLNLIIKKEYFINSFKFFNLENYIILPDEYHDNKSFICLSYSNNGLCCDKINLKIDYDNLDEILDISHFSNFDNNKLGNIQNITNLKVLRKNDLFCIGTNNSKLMII